MEYCLYLHQEQWMQLHLEGILMPLGVVWKLPEAVDDRRQMVATGQDSLWRHRWR
jgi:hypothetical protein